MLVVGAFTKAVVASAGVKAISTGTVVGIFV